MTSPIRLHRWDDQTDGKLSEGSMLSKLESLEYAVTKYVYSPGTYFPDHSHSIDKIDGVLSGQFEMKMFGQTIVLSAGDYLEVPRGAIHSARVIGSEPVVSLDATRR